MFLNGGDPGQCGWINHEKFVVTWQVIPSGFQDYMRGADKEGSARAMKAMLTMNKLDIAALKKAYEGK